ncbi:MAG: zinc ribbon domain-containing protein [Natronomonas sp.]
MQGGSRKRPLVAAMLSFLQPGLGHLYLREWGRAVGWLAIRFGTVAAIVFLAPSELATSDVIAVALGLFIAMDGVPLLVVAAVIAVTAFATADAYLVTNRNNVRLERRGTGCPACGKDLDPSLSFCHWCTTELDTDEAADVEDG